MIFFGWVQCVTSKNW